MSDMDGKRQWNALDNLHQQIMISSIMREGIILIRFRHDWKKRNFSIKCISRGIHLKKLVSSLRAILLCLMIWKRIFLEIKKRTIIVGHCEMWDIGRNWTHNNIRMEQVFGLICLTKLNLRMLKISLHVLGLTTGVWSLLVLFFR